MIMKYTKRCWLLFSNHNSPKRLCRVELAFRVMSKLDNNNNCLKLFFVYSFYFVLFFRKFVVKVYFDGIFFIRIQVILYHLYTRKEKANFTFNMSFSLQSSMEMFRWFCKLVSTIVYLHYLCFHARKYRHGLLEEVSRRLLKLSTSRCRVYMLAFI